MPPQTARRWERWADTHLDVSMRSGDEWVAKCAFHDDRSPSMSVNVKKGVFYCHSCHEGGSIQKLARQLNAALTSDVSLTSLAQDIATLRSGPEEVRIYPEGWLAQFDHPHPYWRKRGFKRSTIKRFSLGYDEAHDAVTIPLRNRQGQVIGVIRRRLGDGYPRYLYPKGFALRSHLWGESEVRKHSGWGSRTLVITEGSLDAISVWEAGIPAVALLGSRLTKEQAQIVKRLNMRRIVVFTDDDDAGYHAVETVADGLHGVLIDVVVYQDGWGTDPASLTVDERVAAVKRAIPLRDWYAL